MVGLRWRRAPSSCSESERAARIDAVLQGLLRLGDDRWPDDATLARSHPKLMPDLCDRLRVMRAIRSAAIQAGSQRSQAGQVGWLDEVGENELRFLQEELQDYEVLEQVQYGGQGVVYKAVQRSTKRLVALKVLLDGPLATPRQRLRFAREVELCSRLQHPHIVTLYASGVVRGRNFCAMEFVEGLPIDEYVLLHAPPVREIVRLFVTVCQAVSYAHQRGIIHRDLSPANIMVDLDGRPHILDFGLAKDVWTDDKDGSSVSIAGQVVGTLPYLSPEQAAGLDAQIDVRSDIYSLGVVLYQLLSGTLPYPDATNPAALRERILSTQPVPLRTAVRRRADELPGALDGVTRDLETILGKALAAEQECRYQSAAALAEDLERYLAGDAVAARAQSTLYLLRKAVRRHRVAFGVAALFVVLLGISAAVVTGLWIEAAAQRDNARQAARIAHATLDNVVTEVNGAVTTLAGGIAVRDRLLSHVAAELPALERVAASDVALIGVLQKLYECQGDIDIAQGRRAMAQQRYGAFLDAASRQNAADPANAQRRSDLSRAHYKLAKAVDDAEEHYRRAIEIATQLVAEQPREAEFIYPLWQMRLDFAQHLFVQGRFEAAASELDAAIALRSTTDPASADDERWMALAALTYERDGEVRLTSGEGSRALTSLEECLRLRERLSAAHPADVDCRQNLLRAALQLASAYRDAARLGDARRLYEQAVSAATYLTSAEPDVSNWRHNLIVAHDGAAAVLLDTNDLASAEPHCEAMVTLATSFCQSDPTNLMAAGLLAGAHLRRAHLLLALQDAESARSDYEDAVAICRESAQRQPGNLALRTDLALAYEPLGACYRKLGYADEARMCYMRSYELRQSVYQAQPDVLQSQLGFILAQTKLAVWYMDRDNPEDDALAAEFLCEAEAALTALQESGRLAGQEGRYGRWLPATHKNQAILAERAKCRAASEQDTDQASARVPVRIPP